MACPLGTSVVCLILVRVAAKSTGPAAKEIRFLSQVPRGQATACTHTENPHDAQFEMGVLFSEGVLVQPVCGGTGRGQQLYIVLNWCHRCSLRHTTLRSASGTKPTNPTPKSVSSNRTRLEARPIPGRCTSMDLGYMHRRCISSGR